MITFKKLALLLLFLGVTLTAQVTYSVIIPTTPPGGVGGACNSPSIAYLMPTGSGNNQLVVCTANVWTVSGGGGGGSPAGSTGDLQTNGGGGMFGAITPGTGIAAALAVNVGNAGAPVLFNGAGGTPSSLTLTNALGLPIAGITGLGSGVGTALAIGIGSAGAPVLFNGALGTPSSGTLTNATGLPIAGITGLGTGVATALAANVSGSGPICLATGSACAPNAGTVTSVGFTGGLISVANPTTTPAFTVAGTSGGIPYFSGAATWASSGAGVQGAMMAWGGAGNAPTSPLSLLVTNQNAASETWTWYNSTASTGKTSLAYRAGASVASGDLMFPFYENNGTTIAGGMIANFTDGRFSMGARGLCISDPLTAANWASCVGGFAVITNSTFGMSNNFELGWPFLMDIGMCRNTAGILDVNNGTCVTTAANYRPIKASAHYIAGTTFTASGCSNGTLVGGATAGKLTLGANNCTVVITMGNSATAPNGWNCGPQDQTTALLTAGVYQSASNATTATFTVPMTAGSTDVISFDCIGY